MSLVKLGRPFFGDPAPEQFQRAENEQGFADSQKQGRNDVARPMRSEINPRIPDGESQKPIKPAALAIEECATHGDDGVVCHVAGGKGWPRAIAITLIGISNRRPLEEGEKFRTRLLQLNHADSVNLFRAMAIYGRLQKACHLFGNKEADEQTENESTSLESAKDGKREADKNE